MRWLAIVVIMVSVGCSNPVDPGQDVRICGLTYMGRECYRRDETITSVMLEVELRNDDTLPIDIVKWGEEYSPSSRLDPGAQRTVRVLIAATGFWWTAFRAGRNGVDVAEVGCMYRYPFKSPPEPGKVAWDGNVLTCSGALHNVEF